MDKAKNDLDIYLKKHPTASLKTIFKYFRNRKDLEIYGDWPLIAQIAHSAAKLNRIFTPHQIAEVCKLTNDPFLKKQRCDSKLVLILSNKDELKCR